MAATVTATLFDGCSAGQNGGGIAVDKSDSTEGPYLRLGSASSNNAEPDEGVVISRCYAVLGNGGGLYLRSSGVANVSDSYYEKSDPKHGSNHHLMLPEVAAEHPDLYRLLTARTKARLPAELLAALRVNTSVGEAPS